MKMDKIEIIDEIKKTKREEMRLFFKAQYDELMNRERLQEEEQNERVQKMKEKTLQDKLKNVEFHFHIMND